MELNGSIINSVGQQFHVFFVYLFIAGTNELDHLFQVVQHLLLCIDSPLHPGLVRELLVELDYLLSFMRLLPQLLPGLWRCRVNLLFFQSFEIRFCDELLFSDFSFARLMVFGFFLVRGGRSGGVRPRGTFHLFTFVLLLYTRNFRH